MKLIAAVLLCVLGLSAQTKSALISSSEAIFAQAKDDVMKSAEMVPENLWSFKPSPDVRTMGQLFAHIADAQYIICGIAIDGKPTQKGIEKTAKTKAEIVAALKDAFAYCDASFAKLTDASAVETVSFGKPTARITVMDYNTAHTMLHYGNLVTYMRIKGVVPPSSTPQPK